MDRFNFDAIDQDAFLKHDLMMKRREKILCLSEETKPTSKQLYGDRVLHRDNSTTAVETNAQILKQPQKMKHDRLQEPSLTLSTRSQTKLDYIKEQSVGSSIVLRNAALAQVESDGAAREWLERRYFNIDSLQKPNSYGSFPFHEAVGEGHIGMMNWLISRCDGKIIRMQDNSGITPLHLAAMTGNEAVTRWLVNNGACVIYKYDPFFGTNASGERG
jgi:hypothetical protein